MSDQFVAEIRLFACNFAPIQWALCQGQLLPITQNTALFSLLGTNFGGDGKSTFALPNLSNAVPIGSGDGPGLTPRSVGEEGGEPFVTLVSNQMPSHSHNVVASTTTGTATASSNNQLAVPTAGGSGKLGGGNIVNFYSPNTAKATTQLSPNAIGIAGGSMAHNNMMPFLGLTYCIALQGIFPPRS